MEACLNEELPPTTELEEGLRNGVYLAKLGNFFSPKVVSLKKIYDREQTRYKVGNHISLRRDPPMLLGGEGERECCPVGKEKAGGERKAGHGYGGLRDEGGGVEWGTALAGGHQRWEGPWPSERASEHHGGVSGERKHPRWGEERAPAEGWQGLRCL